MGAKEGRVLVSSYNSPLGARSSMDRIRVSEALDTGSIPVGRAISRSSHRRSLERTMKLPHILLEADLVALFDVELLLQ